MSQQLAGKGLPAKIQKLFSENPNISKRDLVDKLVEDKELRLQKIVIEKNVEKFLAGSTRKVQQIDLQGIPQLKKKQRPTYQFMYETQQVYQFKNYGGIGHIVEKMQKNIFTPIKLSKVVQPVGFEPPKGFLLVGCTGAGKTSLGKGILREIKQIKPSFTTFYCDYTDLINNPDQSLKKLFNSASQNEPAFIFIDGLDNFCSKENKKELRPVDYLIRELDQVKSSQIYCLSTASSPDKVDSALLREGRLSMQIIIQHPNEVLRTQILEKMLEGKVKIDISNLVTMTAGFVAADLKMLMSLVSIQHYQRVSKALHTLSGVPLTEEESAKVIAENCINDEDFINALTEYTPLGKKQGFTSIPEVTLDDVGALKSIKEEMYDSIIFPIMHSKEYKLMGLDAKAGIILYGPPGCGKTLIAKAIANAAKANFIAVKGPEMLSKYVGDSQQAIRQVFQRAKLSSPCIIFFDEFDGLAPKRQDQGNQVMQRVVNTLLVQLDGIEKRNDIYVIAATNRIDILDQAMLRSGRFEKKLKVDLPTPQQRVEIMKALVRRSKLDESVDLQVVSMDQRCDKFAGADLQFIYREACARAIRNRRDYLDHSDFMESLKKVEMVKYSKS